MKKVQPNFRYLRIVALTATLGFTASSMTPAHAGLFSISPEKERKMGEEAAREIERQARIVRGPVADWVNLVGQRLVAASDPEFKYSFKVIDSPEINAFALPGGYIYVYTGLRKVAQTDDELAAVLAHEITHAEQHHYAKQYKKASTRGILLGVGAAIAGLPNVAQQAIGLLDFSMTQKYSRSHEFESDDMGIKRMTRAGFNPNGM
ncbi:MAG TPA: M48 family metalloprotease, partial [Abditibacteriaceae bacterium]